MKIYEKIDEKIIDLLSEGVAPWRKPFNVLDVLPFNPVREGTTVEGFPGHSYKGWNCWLLSLSIYDDPFWVGFQQVKELGDGDKFAHVRKGESGWPVMYPYFLYYDKDGNRLSAAEARKLAGSEVSKEVRYGYSNVWNVEQCENIDREKLPTISNRPALDFEPLQKCEQVLSDWKGRPPIEHKGHKAKYHFKRDEVSLPDKRYFESEEDYYSTLFHECIHATGHSQRLDREKGSEFGDKEYGYEELVAEIGSSYLCGVSGIEKPLLENKSAYIQNWLSVFSEHEGEGMIVKAQRDAREAVELILDEKLH